MTNASYEERRTFIFVSPPADETGARGSREEDFQPLITPSEVEAGATREFEDSAPNASASTVMEVSLLQESLKVYFCSYGALIAIRTSAFTQTENSAASIFAP